MFILILGDFYQTWVSLPLFFLKNKANGQLKFMKSIMHIQQICDDDNHHLQNPLLNKLPSQLCMFTPHLSNFSPYF
jgi:hypothetical protein